MKMNEFSKKEQSM